MERFICGEAEIEKVVLSSRYFPMKISNIVKKISMRESEISKLIDRMVESDQVREIVGTDCCAKYIHKDNIAKIEREIIELLSKSQKNNPFILGLSRGEVRKKISNKGKQKSIDSDLYNMVCSKMILDKRIKESGNLLSTFEFEVAKDDEYQDKVEKKVKNLEKVLLDLRYRSIDIFKLMSESNLTKKDIRFVAKILMEEGKVIKIEEDRYLHMDIISDLKDFLRKWIVREGSIQIRDITAITGVGRKVVVPIMEYLDSTGYTIREGNERFLG
jgi:selenocysteine-specific elongation factor